MVAALRPELPRRDVRCRGPRPGDGPGLGNRPRRPRWLDLCSVVRAPTGSSLHFPRGSAAQARSEPCPRRTPGSRRRPRPARNASEVDSSAGTARPGRPSPSRIRRRSTRSAAWRYAADRCLGRGGVQPACRLAVRRFPLLGAPLERDRLVAAPGAHGHGTERGRRRARHTGYVGGRRLDGRAVPLLTTRA